MFSLDIAYAVFTLILIVLGLAVIFGMLRVINMAHGEMVMLGCYSVYLTSQYQLPFIVGVSFALLVTGLIGGFIYWLIIKRIRTRLLDTILATWGISIVLKQLVTILFGPAGQHIAMPITAQVMVFGSPYPVYRLLVMLISLLSVIALYVMFFKTTFGIKARAVMSNAILSACVGVHRERMNIISFMVGSMMAGLAGAMISPLISISPLMGEDYLIPSFLSVLIGGLGSIAAPIAGATAIASTETSIALLYNPVVAQMVMLGMAIVLLKLFPNGLFYHKR